MWVRAANVPAGVLTVVLRSAGLDARFRGGLAVNCGPLANREMYAELRHQNRASAFPCAVARRLQASHEFVVHFSYDASSESIFVCRKEGAGFLRMFLGNFAEGPGESFDDHVVPVCCKQGADLRHSTKVFWISAPTQSNCTDKRSTSQPAVIAMGPCGDGFVGESAAGPDGAGEVHCKTVDRRPAIEASAELQEVVHRELFKGKLVIADYFIGEEA